MDVTGAVLCAALTNFVHHGMIYVPTGYSFGPQMSLLNKPEVRQGSPDYCGSWVRSCKFYASVCCQQTLRSCSVAG